MQQGRTLDRPSAAGQDRTVSSRGQIPGRSERDDEDKIIFWGDWRTAGQGPVPNRGAQRRLLRLPRPTLRAVGAGEHRADKIVVLLRFLPRLQIKINRPIFRHLLLPPRSVLPELIVLRADPVQKPELERLLHMDERNHPSLPIQEHPAVKGDLAGGGLLPATLISILVSLARFNLIRLFGGLKGDRGRVGYIVML